MSKFCLKLNDFNHISQVVHAVLAVDNREKYCNCFAHLSALLLKEHFDIEARATAGLFALRVTPDKCMMYGKVDEDGSGYFTIDDVHAYHVWVETPTHVLDFMSPFYQENDSIPADFAVPPRMFQKRKRACKTSLDETVSVGDYFLIQDAALTSDKAREFFSHPVSQDWFDIADRWLSQKKVSPEIEVEVIHKGVSSRRLARLPTAIAKSAW